MMHIANPMYDVVFKYLMEDPESAILLLSTILDEEIMTLTVLPQEQTILLPQRSLTVYRLDFAATVKQPDGTEQQILIEIQKAKFAADIMRFRRYLGDQYQKKTNVYVTTHQGEKTRHARPIVSVYFLGYRLDHVTAPVIKVARQYVDVTTGDILQAREEFIESLTHDSYVIQIPCLRPEHTTEVEQLLSVFDQRHATEDGHILRINEADVPKKYRRILRRLHRAVEEPAVQQTMDAEDDILEELQDLERAIARKDETIAEQGKALAEQEQALAEKERALAEQQKVIESLRQQLHPSAL